MLQDMRTRRQSLHAASQAACQALQQCNGAHSNDADRPHQAGAAAGSDAAAGVPMQAMALASDSQDASDAADAVAEGADAPAVAVAPDAAADDDADEEAIRVRRPEIPLLLRATGALCLISVFKQAEFLACMCGAEPPTADTDDEEHNARIRGGYALATQRVRQAQAEHPELAYMGDMNQRRVKKFARRYAARILQCASVADIAHPAGKAHDERLQDLDKMVSILAAGDQDGQPFRNIAEAREMSVEFDRLAKGLNLSNETIWRELRICCPSIYRGKKKFDKERTAEDAVSFSEQQRGAIPQQFPPCATNKGQLRFVPDTHLGGESLAAAINSSCNPDSCVPLARDTSAASATPSAAASGVNTVGAGVDDPSKCTAIARTMRAAWQASCAAVSVAGAAASRAGEVLYQRAIAAPACNALARTVAAIGKVHHDPAAQHWQPAPDAAPVHFFTAGHFGAPSVRQMPTYNSRAQMYLRPAPAPGSVKGPDSFSAQTVPVSGQWVDVSDPRYRYHWHPMFVQQQWCIDAFTVDPHDFLQGLTAIRIKGKSVPVAQNGLLNKSVGQLPRMHVYIAVHAKHGTRVYFPRTGAQGGGRGAARDAVYAGYGLWYETLDAQSREQLRTFLYYNQAKAAEAVRQQAEKGHGLEPELFKVLQFHELKNSHFLICCTAATQLCMLLGWPFRPTQTVPTLSPNLLAHSTFLPSRAKPLAPACSLPFTSAAQHIPVGASIKKSKYRSASPE